MLVGQKKSYQPSFPYNLTENSPTSLVHKTVFVDSNNFKFGTKTHYMVSWTIPDFGINLS